MSGILAVVRKEITEVIRRPGALLSLIVGPFVIMAIFGVGYNGYRRALSTIVVVPPGSSLLVDRSPFQEIPSVGFQLVAVTSDLDEAKRELEAEKVDVVVVVPTDLQSTFQAGRQSTVTVIVNLLDPIQAGYASFLAERLSGALNQNLIERAVRLSQEQSTASGISSPLLDIPPAVVAAPTRAALENLAPAPAILSFFGPAVVALILQHMAITLSALSFVRERYAGTLDLFRMSPTSALELLVGKYIAFSILIGVVAALVLGLLRVAFDLPFVASPLIIAGIVSLLVFASVGIGLVISAVSDSERQAVQLTMLVLLASVFFSGFVLPVEEFSEPVQAVSYSLPVTHGIRLLQHLLLRGSTNAVWEIWVLAGIGVAIFGFAWLSMRRSLASI